MSGSPPRSASVRRRRRPGTSWSPGRPSRAPCCRTHEGPARPRRGRAREACRQGRGAHGRIAVIRALEESPSRARRSSPLRSPTSCLTISALTSWGFVRTTFTSENPALSNFALYSSAGRAPASHPLQAEGLSLSFSGTGFSSTTSDTQNRPPGARTRAASAKTASLSGERLMTQLESRTSAPPS